MPPEHAASANAPTQTMVRILAFFQDISVSHRLKITDRLGVVANQSNHGQCQLREARGFINLHPKRRPINHRGFRRFHTRQTQFRRSCTFFQSKSTLTASKLPIKLYLGGWGAGARLFRRGPTTLNAILSTVAYLG